MAQEAAGTDDKRDLPLAGIRILAVEQYGAGPFASLYLSDMGAEVIKIEAPADGPNPGGDSSRQSGPHFLGQNDSYFFQTFNLGKKSLTLDMRKPEGREVFLRLVLTADAVMNNLRGDQPEKLGLTHTALAGTKPSIVCAHLSGYGRTGHRKSWPAYDYLMQAEAGFLSLTGEPDGPATRMGLSIVDYLSGITMALALTAALLGAARTGRGRDVDVTLFDVAVHQLTYPAAWYLNAGDVVERRPRSGHPAVVPCETFPTRDGSIFVMCILPKFWISLCRELGLPELVDDPRFAEPAGRFANRDALAALLDSAFAGRSTAEWVQVLAGKVPVAPVFTLPKALDSSYLSETGMIQSFDHPQHPNYRVLSNPIRVDGARLEASRAPALGEHSDAVLREAGLTAGQIAALRAANVI
ncbi:CoA transferase [Mesorhizobium sp. CN2-181]|uniref:CaiB/BaiF CoA transferase family protein n=1 Tax=Mesorhizobium yinganensis TaxID=3157707 RepID=UPI0032B84983